MRISWLFVAPPLRVNNNGFHVGLYLNKEAPHVVTVLTGIWRRHRAACGGAAVVLRLRPAPLRRPAAGVQLPLDPADARERHFWRLRPETTRLCPDGAKTEDGDSLKQFPPLEGKYQKTNGIIKH